MLRGRSAVTIASSVSSVVATSRCLLGLRRGLWTILSLPGWTAATACSPACQAVCLLDGLQSVLNAATRLFCSRRKSAYNHVTPSSVIFSAGCQSHSASSSLQPQSTRFSITLRSCSRVPARLLHRGSFLRVRDTPTIT